MDLRLFAWTKLNYQTVVILTSLLGWEDMLATPKKVLKMCSPLQDIYQKDTQVEAPVHCQEKSNICLAQVL